MLSTTASAFLRFAGWSYIPNYATHQVLAFYHRFLQSRGRPVPQQGTITWQNHYRTIYAIVVLGFLGYNFVEAARTTPPNFFQILGATPKADENALKLAFRAFARKNHPDRVGPSGEAWFITVRDAYEALKNPTTRFAYERFGPDALNWRECRTSKDFIRRGMMQASGFYIGTGGILAFLSVALKRSPVAFWRCILLFTLLASELCLILGYDSSGLLKLIFPNRVAFQHVLFLHQVFVFLSVALSQVVPVLFPEPPSIRPDDPRTYAPFLERLGVLAKAADREVSRMLHIELHAMHGLSSIASFSDLKPCQPSDSVMDALTREMENMIVEHQLHVEAPVHPLWDAAVHRNREHGRHRSPSPPTDDSINNELLGSAVKALGSSVKGGTSGRLLSPPMSQSPEARVMELAPMNGHLVGLEDDDGRKRVTNLPSPRPSPPPSELRSRPNSPASRIVNGRQHSAVPAPS